MQHPTLQMNGKKNIFLIGFMGAGKSTIARCLHSHHGMEWLEMDKEIETSKAINEELVEKMLDAAKEFVG